MDNLGSHKGSAMRRAIRAAGVGLLLLPKYSPDLNPIEQFFAKLKHWLRKAAKRTTNAVCNATRTERISSLKLGPPLHNGCYPQVQGPRPRTSTRTPIEAHNPVNVAGRR